MHMRCMHITPSTLGSSESPGHRNMAACRLAQLSQHLLPSRCTSASSAAGKTGDKPRLIVTGLNGLIGTAVLQALSPHYQLVAINRRPMDLTVPGAKDVECVQADVSDLDAIKHTFVGAVGTIHLVCTADVRPISS